MLLLIENQLFPSVYFFILSIRYKHIKIEQYDRYQKMSFRNRYLIMGANGILPLSIPLIGGREQKKLTKEVLVDNATDWRTIHWRSIVSAYSRAPFFEYYADSVYALLFTEEEKLYAFNLKILSFLFKVLNVNVSYSLTDGFAKDALDCFDFRDKMRPKNYTDFATPHYLQVFHDRNGFAPNLSILDLLFCEGPNAGNLLLNFVKNKQ